MVGPAVDAQSAVHRTVCQDSPQEMQLGKSLKGERENAAEGVQSCRVCGGVQSLEAWFCLLDLDLDQRKPEFTAAAG